jgi:hypothetical protein
MMSKVGDVIKNPVTGERVVVRVGTEDSGGDLLAVDGYIRLGARFEEMALNLFGLAQDGKTNSKGMPNLLQAAIFAREFSDVLYFTKPPLWVQRLLFGVLAGVARALGYRGSYPEYLERGPSERVEVEPWTSPV